VLSRTDRTTPTGNGVSDVSDSGNAGMKGREGVDPEARVWLDVSAHALASRGAAPIPGSRQGGDDRYVSLTFVG
jgi:hypothetical protein